MPDKDIMDQLKEINEDELVGQEVSFDDDLDFEGLDNMDEPAVSSPTIDPPAPRADSVEVKPDAKAESVAKKSQAEADAEVKPDVKDESATKKPSKLKPSKPKATTKSAQIPARVGTSVTDTEELVVRAKILRIVADKIIIEPGANISFSQ